MSDVALKVEHKTARDWLDALDRVCPATAADDPAMRCCGFQGSDGIVHSIGLSGLKVGLHEMTPATRELLKTPEGRDQLYAKGG
jgi:hypothetical protein